MSLIDDIKAGLRMVPEAISRPDNNIYPIGVTAIGKKRTPNVLQKMGCVSIFAVPIVGGVIGVVNAIGGSRIEQAIPICAGSIGLLIFAAATTLRLRKK